MADWIFLLSVAYTDNATYDHSMSATIVTIYLANIPLEMEITKIQ